MSDDFKKSKIKSLTLYTGSNGKKGCTCNCLGCSQEKYGKQHAFYQGTIEQVKKILNEAPNIERAIILGNPDPSVDPEFCNEVAYFFISKGIRVRFSSSGFQALNTAKKLLKNLNPNYVDYISYSIDTLDENKARILKGQAISIEEVNRAIKYCNEAGISTKIQPTLWEINKFDYINIIEEFEKNGVKWFSFHAGSLETFTYEKENLQHIEPKEWREILADIGRICKEKRLRLHMPYLYLSQNEYAEYVRKNTNRCNPRNLINTQIWLEKEGLRTTHCPLLREVQNFDYDFMQDDFSELDYSPSKYGYCPAARKCQGEVLSKKSVDGHGNKYIFENDQIYTTVCRFYNFSI